MKKIFFSIIAVHLCSVVSKSQPVTFNYTGAAQTYTVGTCVYSITLDIKGGEGLLVGGSSGGKGGRVQATIPVTPGEVLNIYVGGSAVASTGGWNGGGNATGAAGGGASDIRSVGTALSNRIVVAGGGGGAGSPAGCLTNSYGGSGGGLIAGNGWWCGSNSSSEIYTGKGGTQTSGGAANTGGSGIGQAGTFGNGGNGSGQGGAGGGGWYGGGGSGSTGGGGGGSSYVIASATGVTHTPGFQTGDGQIIITPSAASGPSAPGTITGASSVCSGSIENYSVSPVPTATTYSWTVPSGAIINSGQTTASITVTFGSTSGIISVNAGNSCGTSAASTKTITVNPNPSVNAGTDESICVGDSIQLNSSGSGTFSWAPPAGLSCTNCPNPVAFPNTTTTYTVTINDVCGTASDEIVIMVDSCAVGVSSAIASNEKFFIYPNPTKGEFTVYSRSLPDSYREGLQFTACELEIRNLLGEKVYSDKIVHSGSCIVHSDFPAGIYFVKIIPIAIGTEKESLTYKIIKQ